MVKNSTLLLIVDEPGGESEIVDLDEIVDLQEKDLTALDYIFSFFDYSPSDKIIDRILEYSNRR